MARNTRTHPSRSRPRAAPGGVDPPRPGAAAAIGLVVVAGAVAAFGWAGGCKREPPPGAVAPRPSAAPPRAIAPAPAAASAVSHPDASVVVATPEDAGAGDGAPAYEGPLLAAIALQAPVFSTMDWSKDKRIGYMRAGGKAAVDPKPVKASNCDAGWYRLLPSGYVCGKYATLDLNHAQVRLATAANLEDVLPYRYAYNSTMGTPLYRSVPTRDEMLRYEPYLKGAAHADGAHATTAARHRERRRDGDPGRWGAGAEGPAESPDDVGAGAGGPAGDPGGPSPGGTVGSADAGAPGGADASVGAGERRKPWWLHDFDGGKPPDIRLSDLTEGSDALVARRMVKGFFIAIDKTFGWNNRLWHKTTGGLVAPADRFGVVKAPTFQGLEVPEAGARQAVFFVLATHASRWEMTQEGEKWKVTAKGPAERFTSARLTGTTRQVSGILFRETSEGWWLKSIDGTYTEPGPPPEGLRPGEKWIDVNIARQTLVAFEGDRPVFATLISSGRKSKDKLRDHTTVKGSFRVREKHVTTTMDGDGPAPGDMPYSIEDVPYVMYFEGSYALHGAFWHSDYGREKSHGCVNLSPLDARRLFFWTDPPLPMGWHGIWAQKETPGTRVVVHD